MQAGEVGNSNNDGWAVTLVDGNTTIKYLNVTEWWKEGREKRLENTELALGAGAASESSRGKPGTDPKRTGAGGGFHRRRRLQYFAAMGVDAANNRSPSAGRLSGVLDIRVTDTRYETCS